ncbi:hypothetical protein FSARC_4036 [Fusarium sarcochroum]|uniref:Uncharacterized protein n=1 Tax=Fusarium sarcochroum TaxID=1208366 RepID=A0A8H4XB55_9HYPO|nr:hypothetical protein FSARC_4036 [Fusarium sarcochroum]
MFPNIHTLVLTEVPLTESLARAWYDFLLGIVRLEIPIELESLELQELCSKDDDEDDDNDPILILLDPSKGLVDLFVDQCGMTYSMELWEHLCPNHLTLRRFVNHSRFYDDDRTHDWIDSPDMMIEEEDRDEMWERPFLNPLYVLDLEFIGLSCDPTILIEVLYTFTKKSCLKVIHVRQSKKTARLAGSWAIASRPSNFTTWPGPVLLGFEDDEDSPKQYLNNGFPRFLEWAFEPHGIKSLEYVVFGDFARPERYLSLNLLFCRNEGETRVFRAIKESSAGPEWKQVMKEYGNALMSCPLEPPFQVPRPNAP